MKGGYCGREPPKRNPLPVRDPDLFIVFKFSRGGWLREIYFDVPEKEDELVLAGKLMSLFRPGPLTWLSRLFRWGK